MMKKFLTPKEAADYLRITERDLEEIVDKKGLSSYKIGGVYTRFSIDDLDDYLRKVHDMGVETDNTSAIADRIKDFFYFNNFYILSGIVVIIILYFIFR